MIDHRIILGIQAPKIATVQENETQAAKLRREFLEQNVAAFRLQKEQREAQAEQQMQEVLQKHGGNIEAALPEITSLSPELGMKLSTSLAQQKKTALDLKLGELKQRQEEVGFVGQLMGSAADPESYSRARETLEKSGVDVSGLPEQFDPAIIREIGVRALTVKERLDAEMKQIDDARQEMLANAQVENYKGMAADRAADNSRQSAQMAETARHNRAVEGNAAARLAHDKASGTAAGAGKPNVGAIMGEIETLSKRINTEGGGPMSNITGMMRRGKAAANLDNDVSEYEALVQGMIPMVARANGHTGVLTQQDVDSTRNLFPKVGDNKTLAENKLARVKKLIGSNAVGAAGATAAPTTAPALRVGPYTVRVK